MIKILNLFANKKIKSISPKKIEMENAKYNI